MNFERGTPHLGPLPLWQGERRTEGSDQLAFDRFSLRKGEGEGLLR
jgi:hypothetical protein